MKLEADEPRATINYEAVDDVLHQGKSMCERVLLGQEQADLHGDGDASGELARRSTAFVTAKGNGARRRDALM